MPNKIEKLISDLCKCANKEQEAGELQEEISLLINNFSNEVERLVEDAYDKGFDKGFDEGEYNDRDYGRDEVCP